MPFECRRNMTWGPGNTPVALKGGDEVPAPVKATLLQIGHVAKVAAVAGKKWCDQPEESQRLWAECNGQNVLTETRRETVKGEVVESEPVVVKVKTHPTQMIEEDSNLPERIIHRPLEAPGPARSEPQEVAGGEVMADEPAPPLASKPAPGQGRKHKRGRRSRR